MDAGIRMTARACCPAQFLRAVQIVQLPHHPMLAVRQMQAGRHCRRPPIVGPWGAQIMRLQRPLLTYSHPCLDLALAIYFPT